MLGASVERACRLGVAGLVVTALAVVRADGEPAKALAPIPPATLTIMAAKGTTAAAPLVIRTYKKEAELEIWKQNRDGRFVYIKTFPICRWSGQLGPKQYPGDRQTPEGFYSVSARQMNPNSHYYLSFDTGFPNAYDKAHGASGSAVMIHGTCSSMGCFAMTDKQIGEIYAIARDALEGGQAAFQLQAFPFRMTAQNMALYRSDRNIEFWRQLKEGSDRFEATRQIPVVKVVAGRYTFAPAADPASESAAQAFRAAEMAKISALVKDGSAAVVTTYADGGQHAIFASMLRHGANLGTVSRPEALPYAGLDVTLVRARRRAAPPPTQTRIVRAVGVQARIVKPRVAALPASLGSALTAAPISYRVLKAPADATLIAGAMPLRGSTLSN